MKMKLPGEVIVIINMYIYIPRYLTQLVRNNLCPSIFNFRSYIINLLSRLSEQYNFSFACVEGYFVTF